MFAGLVDPGNIAIVREIITPSAAQTVGNVDTAVFSGPQADYDISVSPATPGTLAAVTVAHVRGTATDGTDTLRNVERASFCNTPGAVLGTCDVPRVLVSIGFPSAGLSVSSLGFGTRAIGAAAATLPVTLTNTGGGTLTVSGSTISGANATSFSATSNCTNLTGGATCTFNVSFAPTAAGVRTAQLNIATNAGPPSVVTLTGTGVVNTPATGAATISDTTPTEGTAVTASTATIADVNGLPATFGVQWSQSAVGGGGALTPIAGATGLSFTPLQAQVNRRLAVVVTFVDLAGSAESRTSLSTTVVGDLFLGTAGVDTLTGTAGQDDYHGGASADNLSTGAENDNVSGDAGNDTISTGAGNDNIWFTGTGEGFDAVTGGADVDTIHALTNNTNIGLRSIATVEAITADGHTGVRILGSTGNDVLDFTGVTLTGIAEINGGGGSDSLTGSAGADVLVGLAGNDTVNGGAGIDILEGGAGNDTMNGGAGNDFFRFSNGFGADTINGFDATAAGGQDLIDLRALGIVDIASFVARVTVANNGGGRTLITVTGGGTIRLNGVGVANVNIGDFLLA